MNILYLHTHDLGRYVGAYGYPPRMPNLQRLAEQGTLFRNAFCAAPTCSPSRAALLTGTYPHQCGMYGLPNQGWTLNDPSRHLAAFLAGNGYETALAGAEHVAPGRDAEANRAMGYTRVLADKKSRPMDEREPVTEAAIAFLAANPDRPFFLDVGYGLTHHAQWDRTFVVSQPILGDLDWRYVRPLPHLPDTPATRWEAAMQFRAAEYLDIHLGRVLDALEASGLADYQLPTSAAAESTAIRFGPATGAGPLGESVANTFRGGSYTQRVLGEELTLYRSYGGKAGQLSPYWTRTAPTGPLQATMDSALNPAWGNTAQNMAKIRVPAGTTIYDGFVAPQGNLLGGGSQVYIPKVNPNWIVPNP